MAIGTSANEVLQGSPGDDTHQGNAGNDTLNGGGGTDVAVFSGALEGYRFGIDSSRRLTVTDIDPQDGNDGIDVLSGMEIARFSDASIELQLFRQTRVNSTTLGNQFAPAVASTRDGGCVAVWQSDDGIYAQQFDADGSAAGPEFRVSATSPGTRIQPAVASLDEGGFAVVWNSLEQDGSGGGIYLQLFDADATPIGTEIRVNSTTAADQSNPSIAGLEGGGLVVAWQSFGPDESSYGVFAQRFDAQGEGVGTETLVITTPANEFAHASVAGLAGGGFIVAWTAFETDGARVYAQQYDVAGNPEGAELAIGTGTRLQQFQPCIAAADDGGYLVCWVGGWNYSDARAWGVYVQRFGSDGSPLSEPVQVNIADREPQDPRIAFTSDGGFVVTWETVFQDGGRGGGVYARFFDADANPMGGERLVNTSTHRDETSPDVAALRDGGWIIVWEDSGQDGSGYGIYSQLYDRNGNTTLLQGDDGANKLSASGSSSIGLYGEGGDDTLDGGESGTSLGYDGGPGKDTITFARSSSPVTLDLARGTFSTVLADSVENAIGSRHDDLLKGNGLANRLEGGAGNDTLNGGAGADTLIGGDGNDSYLLDSARDVLSELPGEGIDSVQSTVSHTLDGNIENLVLLGTALGGRGNNEANMITGNSAPNLLSGSAGNDTLAGGDGQDTLDGGKGDDTYIVSSGDLTAESPNSGNDEVISAVSWTLSENFEALTITGSGNVQGQGNALANSLRGGVGNNTLLGLAGSDLMDGREGKDTLAGGDGSDALYGGQGEDLIRGGAGNDTIDGGSGRDILSGAQGADTFAFSSVPMSESEADLVMDFRSGTDRILLDASVFGAFSGQQSVGEEQFLAGVDTRAATTPEQRLIYDRSTGAMYYDPDGVDGDPAVRIATFGQDSPPLIASTDFVISG